MYAGVQVYTRGPGYNAPSANISDVRLVDADGEIDLLIGGADPGNGGPWLPLRQAIRLHGQAPSARFWSLVFYDWFNTPDFSVHRCYLTGNDVVTQPDGTYEVILGPDRSDHPNWIDTAGLRQGILALRCAACCPRFAGFRT